MHTLSADDIDFAQRHLGLETSARYLPDESFCNVLCMSCGYRGVANYADVIENVTANVRLRVSLTNSSSVHPSTPMVKNT
jgi:hypothetical protein